MASLPSTITNVSHIEHLNNNENNNDNNDNNESYIFSNNRSNWSNENQNENNNENNNSTITQESYNEENSNNNLPFSMNLTKIYRRKSRKMAQTRKAQRGGSKIPGVSNVVRITGTTLKKIGNVGIYGLKKVGNGVHVITHVVNKSVTAVTGRNMKHRGKTAKKAKGSKGPKGAQH
jgi:hypothetical protein